MCRALTEVSWEFPVFTYLFLETYPIQFSKRIYWIISQNFAIFSLTWPKIFRSSEAKCIRLSFLLIFLVYAGRVPIANSHIESHGENRLETSKKRRFWGKLSKARDEIASFEVKLRYAIWNFLLFSFWSCEAEENARKMSLD